MHESTNLYNTVGHRIKKSENGKYYTVSSNKKKVYGPKAGSRGRYTKRTLRTNAGVPMKLRSKLVPMKPRA